jgi:hypothetical protein
LRCRSLHEAGTCLDAIGKAVDPGASAEREALDRRRGIAPGRGPEFLCARMIVSGDGATCSVALS